MKQAILIGVMVWLAVFTASLAAYAVVNGQPAPDPYEFIFDKPDSPWVIA